VKRKGLIVGVRGLSAVVVGLATLGFACATPALASNPTVAAVNNFPVVQGQSAPLGDITITEASLGQLSVGDVITYRFEDSASGATLHFSTAGTVSGTNGLAATVSVASSSASLDDEMKVTITAASSGTFPGVLTLSGLTSAIDAGAATGNDKVLVSDTGGTLATSLPVNDADVITSSTLRAPYTAQSTPTILPTASNQAVGNVTFTEPAKGFFHANDVITLSLRDANGSADTVGLGATPYAAGGSMTVSVSGANGPNVQQNDTAFLVDVVSGDPSQGSASTITISNIVVNSAEAPLGPVTLSAVVTAGPDVGTALISPGRVAVANVGGNTSTTAAGAPTLAVNTAAQPAGNVTINATAGSLQRNDTISFQLQTPGVAYNTTNPPIATVTSGSAVLANATATLSSNNTVATWTVTNPDVTASTIVVGPIYYDVSGSATAGQSVALLASGESGSAFTSQVVTNATLAASPPTGPGVFSTVPASIPSANAAPFTGAGISYTETSPGSTPAGSSLVLISPYATQIAASRTKFASIPTATTSSGNLALGAPTVNGSAVVVATSGGTITAPAQTVAIFPVTAASTGAPATVNFSGLSFGVGDLVPPGTLIVTGVVEASGGITSATGGNQVVDLIDTHNLGTSSATTPPVVSLTQTPPAITNNASAAFAYTSNEAGSTFACSLDGSVVSLNCPSPITLPGLSNGHHKFTVQAFNSSGYGSTPVSYTWTINTVAPTATVAPPATLTGPVVATFSEPVEFINSGTVTLVQTPAVGSPVAVRATMTCAAQGGASGPCIDTDFYTKVSVQSSTPLVPGQHYSLTLNPAGVSPAVSDQAGNALATLTKAFRGGLVQDQSSPAATPAWTSVSSASASGGSYTEDHLAGASASFAFAGTAVTWHTVTGPNQGEANVYVDNVLKASINNYTKTTTYKVARTITGLSSGNHVLKIVVRGLKGSTAGTDTQVAVDDFVVGSAVTGQTGAGVTYAWDLVSASPATGGKYAIDDLAGARYTFTFRGTAIKWATVLGPTMGEASVYVDGVLKGTFNNYASKVTYQASHSVSGLTDAPHTMQIVVLGKHLAPATGSQVAVDGFIVS
jgi:hypothetical protein